MRKALLILLMLVSPLVAAVEEKRVNQDSPAVWETVEYDETSKAAVFIDITFYKGLEQFNGHGSGVIVKVNEKIKYPGKNMVEGYILTCYHVAKPSHSLTIKYQDGQAKSPATVVSTDERRDISLLKAWVPSGTKPMKLASKIPKAGDVVFSAGYGNNYEVKTPNYYKTTVWRYSTLLIVLKEDCRPGQSGSFICNTRGELVGLVSAGTLPPQKYGKELTYTSPCFGPAVVPIRMVILQHILRGIDSYSDEVYDAELSKNIIK